MFLARATPSLRGLRVRSISSLKDTVFAMVPAKQKELKEFNASHGEKSLGNVTIGQVRGGQSKMVAPRRAQEARVRGAPFFSRPVPCAPPPPAATPPPPASAAP